MEGKLKNIENYHPGHKVKNSGKGNHGGRDHTGLG
jgi:hypothetical protein